MFRSWWEVVYVPFLAVEQSALLVTVIVETIVERIVE
jgi:hypothetical protein